jgi:hypothetical protein
MRKFQTGDVFKFARIIKEVDIKDDINEAIKASNEAALKAKQIDADNCTGDNASDAEAHCPEAVEILENAKNEIGVNICLAIITKAGTASMENKIYNFLASVFEMSEKDIETMALESLVDNISRMIANNNIKNFISAAKKLADKTQN